MKDKLRQILIARARFAELAELTLERIHDNEIAFARFYEVAELTLEQEGMDTYD